MKHIIAIAGMMLAGALAASAQNVESLRVSDLQTGRDGSRMFVNMNIDTKAMKLSANNRLEIIPVIWNADSTQSVEFPPVVVAGTNMYYSTMRNGSPEQVAALYRAGRGKTVEYAASVPFEEWMTTSTVALVPRQTGCCGVPKGPERNIPVAKIDLRPRRFTPRFNYVAPLDTAEKRFDLSGRANIRFIVNRTNIDWKYANNYVELDSILRTVNAVKDNPDAKVEAIYLKGFASPEGPYDNNVRLAKGRTEVVKEYVRNNSTFPASIYHTSSVPEDWEGLREWLLGCSLPDRQKMIDFIDDPSVPVRTKNEEFMKRFPKDYPFILTNVYPPLRHTDYRITYTVRKYLNIDEIREVFRTRPRNLSENEFFMLANSYEPGSAEYDEVFDVCVRMYPDNPTANINAANSAMHRSDLIMAERYLLHAGDSPQANYGRGVLYALKGDYAKAVEYLEQARRGGVEDAADAIEQCRLAQEQPEGVKYLVAE